jgi:hypothetical protein
MSHPALQIRPVQAYPLPEITRWRRKLKKGNQRGTGAFISHLISYHGLIHHMTSKDRHADSPAGHERFGTAEHRVKMMEMITGYRVSQIVATAASCSLPEHMSDGAVTAADIAAAESLNVDATFRFMLACASIGLMTHDARTHTFTATPLLGTLHRDNPASLRSRAQLEALDPFRLSWGRLAESLKTGEPQLSNAAGLDFWTWLEGHPNAAALFADAMKGFYPAFDHDAMERIDTTAVGSVVDVGGASGSFVHALMMKNPLLRGVVFDLPFAVERAAERARELGIEARFATVPGDFFKDALPAADLYLLRFILHDWSDESCIAILQNCRRSMNAGGRLVVAERIVGKGADSAIVHLSDLTMLVMLGGKERSEEAFEAFYLQRPDSS